MFYVPEKLSSFPSNLERNLRNSYDADLINLWIHPTSCRLRIDCSSHKNYRLTLHHGITLDSRSSTAWLEDRFKEASAFRNSARASSNNNFFQTVENILVFRMGFTPRGRCKGIFEKVKSEAIQNDEILLRHQFTILRDARLRIRSWPPSTGWPTRASDLKLSHSFASAPSNHLYESRRVRRFEEDTHRATVLQLQES